MSCFFSQSECSLADVFSGTSEAQQNRGSAVAETLNEFDALMNGSPLPGRMVGHMVPMPPLPWFHVPMLGRRIFGHDVSGPSFQRDLLDKLMLGRPGDQI